MSLRLKLGLTIYSSVPGSEGTFYLHKTVVFDAVPRIGEAVELADGWTSTDVERVTWRTDGHPVVQLRRTVTDSPEILDEMAQLCHGLGWSSDREF